MSKASSDISGPQLQSPDPTPGGRQTAPAQDERDGDRLISELREAVRARDDFITVAAHELRNQTTPIQLCARLIRIAEEGGDHVKVVAELARLERLLARFLRRAEVVLDVTQLMSGKLRLEPAEVNLSDLVSAVIDGFRPFLALSGSELAAAIAPGVTGLVDTLALNQIIDNLLSNAIKFGEGKLIELHLDVIGSNARLRVRDYGLGISAEDQARIFEPFERAVRRTNQPGYGLGLWVTRRLTEAMNGSITVSSQKGAGSLFTVTIPLKFGEPDG